MCIRDRRELRFAEPTGRVHRRMAGRTKLATGCGEVAEKEQCCASVDRFSVPCVPAVTTFEGGRVCQSSVWAVRFEPANIGACPARHDPAVNASQPRTKLAPQTGCNTLRNRVQCASATDGRTSAIHLNQPCMPAQDQFLDGTLCQTARYVKDLDFAGNGSASAAELTTPYLQAPMGADTAVHAVQRISLAQTAAERLSQVVTFQAVDCPFDKSASAADCANPTSGTVQLTHNGKVSDAIPLATATPAAIARAFRAVHDELYSGVSATVVSTSATTVIWRLELITPWASCTNQRTLPLVGTVQQAKVNASVYLERPATCLTGGVDVALATDPAAHAFLPWDASEYDAARRIGALLATGAPPVAGQALSDGQTMDATPDSAFVKVFRGGDGHASASFTVTYLSVGEKPLLTLVGVAGRLQKRTFSGVADTTGALSADVSTATTELVAGGADLLPIPGRYLTAPANESVVSLSLIHI